MTMDQLGRTIDLRPSLLGGRSDHRTGERRVAAAEAILLACSVGAGSRVLAVGVAGGDVRSLRRAGFRVDEHRLDCNPAAALRGGPFTPPVKAWPVETGAYDALLIDDELALVVDDEAAIGEAARALRSGGLALLRVPNAGVLAWLDPFNAYRYVRDVTRRGPKLPETRGVGWRRRYGAGDLRELLAPAFEPPQFWTEGIGLADAARLSLLLGGAWLRGRRAPELEARAASLAGRLEAGIRPGGWGSRRIAVARKLGADDLAR
jgi:SAM-dependent methyltransferase